MTRRALIASNFAVRLTKYLQESGPPLSMVNPLLLRGLRNVHSSCRRNLDRCVEVVITSEQRKLRRSGLGAGDGSRTRDPEFGKLMLYQLSYSRGLEGELLTIGTFPMTV